MLIGADLSGNYCFWEHPLAVIKGQKWEGRVGEEKTRRGGLLHLGKRLG